MRSDPTPTENRLWNKLRCRQLGVRFRRQEPIGPYIVDFVCKSRRLVIEVDGESHEDCPGDRIRDAHLGNLGYRVMRIWDTEVHQSLEGVVEDIWALLYEDSSPGEAGGG